MGDKSGMNISHARVPAQIEEMKRIKEDNVCPFCRGNFETYHDEPILKEGEYWLISKNDYPYDGVDEHILLIYKEHIIDPSEISSKAHSEFFEFMTWIRENFPNPGGSFFMRFGDTEYTGASIDHLHAHVITSTATRESSKGKLKVKLGYKS